MVNLNFFNYPTSNDIFANETTNITVAALASLLTGCSLLRKLRLDALPCVTDSLVEIVPAVLPKLEILSIWHTPISRLQGTWSELLVLSVGGHDGKNELIASQVFERAQLPKLRYLDICCKVQERGFDALATACPSLQHLRVVGDRKDRAVSLANLRHPMLIRLDLEETSWHTSAYEGLTNTNLPNLKVLDLSDDDGRDTGLSSESIQRLAASMPQLTDLSLSFCDLDDAAVDAVVQHCSGLICLDISGNRITDVGIRALTRLKELVSVDVGHDQDDEVTADGLWAVATGCPKLCYLGRDSIETATAECHLQLEQLLDKREQQVCASCQYAYFVGRDSYPYVKYPDDIWFV